MKEKKKEMKFFILFILIEENQLLSKYFLYIVGRNDENKHIRVD